VAGILDLHFLDQPVHGLAAPLAWRNERAAPDHRNAGDLLEEDGAAHHRPTAHLPPGQVLDRTVSLFPIPPHGLVKTQVKRYLVVIDVPQLEQAQGVPVYDDDAVRHHFFRVSGVVNGLDVQIVVASAASVRVAIVRAVHGAGSLGLICRSS
jgi:hypothetical protein